MSDRRQLIHHNGKTVIIHNYKGLSGQAYINAVEFNGRAGGVVNLEERLILLDVTDSVVDKEVMKTFKRVSKEASAKVSKTAVVGVAGIQRMFLRTVANFSDLEIRTFDTQAEAIVWLTA